MSTTPELVSRHPASILAPKSALKQPPRSVSWFALEERVERLVRFPHALQECEREELETLIASTSYARELSTFFEEFYAELITPAEPLPQPMKDSDIKPVIGSGHVGSQTSS